MTITSKEYPVPLNVLGLPALFDVPIDTKTLSQKNVRVVLKTYEIDEEKHEIEHAAIDDFLKFEAMDWI
jgi:hypothetical protein